VIISRYLNKEIFHTLLTVTAIILLAFLCQQTVRYLNYVAIGKIPTNVLLLLISFEVPYLLALLLPLNLYLGILLTYGRMDADNEMAILRMCGFGNKQLFGLTAIFAIVVSVIVWVLMLWVNPLIAAKRQQIMDSDDTALHIVQTLMPGRFQTSIGNRSVVYVEKLSRDRQRARNVFLAVEQKHSAETEQNTWVLTLAKEGYQIKDKKSLDPFFVMTDGYRYEGMPGHNDFKLIEFKKYGIRIPQNDMRNTHRRDETLPSRQLWQHYAHLGYAAELQWRISIGITTFILGLLAVPLSRMRSKQGRYLVLLPAILIYIVYINLLFMAQRWIEQGVIPVSIGMWWVHGMMLGVVLFIAWLSRKARV
jgi:lipopolysaccharide export system permease protein